MATPTILDLQQAMGPRAVDARWKVWAWTSLIIVTACAWACVGILLAMALVIAIREMVGW
jgi:hypothetical protein